MHAHGASHDRIGLRIVFEDHARIMPRSSVVEDVDSKTSIWSQRELVGLREAAERECAEAKRRTGAEGRVKPPARARARAPAIGLLASQYDVRK